MAHGYVQDDIGKQFKLSKESADRLLHRDSPMEVVKTIISGTSKDQNRLAHFCYVKLLGIVQNFTNILQGEDRDSYDLTLADVILYESAAELAEQRNHYMVTEDDFAPILAGIISRNSDTYSFARLKEVCGRFDSETGIRKHEVTSAQKCVYFLDRGISADDARAFVFAIAFYTGSQSEMINRGVTMIVRSREKNVIVQQEDKKIGEDASIIMFYLIRALSHLPFYWGTVTRCVALTEKELDDYEPGALVTWLQFSSSMRGINTPDAFRHRNTRFTIESLTGRSIKYFSNIPDEDEVLLLPHSSFLVIKREFFENTHFITMRQVELGLCKYSILWVDDNIFESEWENKSHMEKASTAGVQVNVHFIPKASTETALAFLRSPFGQRLKHKRTFRIVSDMNRLNENPSHNAGARFLASVRQLGFNSACLIFTSSVERAKRQIDEQFKTEKERQNIQVTASAKLLESFVNFSDLQNKLSCILT